MTIPQPDYVIRDNKVKCRWCGTELKTRAKYVAHWNRRHKKEKL